MISRYKALTRESTRDYLYVTLKPNQVPVVYSRNYDIGFFGCEKLHPFDSKKWGKIFDILVENKLLDENSVVEPEEMTEDDLLLVHTKSYLRSLKWSCVAARVTELPPLACCCHCIVNRKILRPFKYQTAGTITAARLALDHGWAINIGGGFHHCSSNNGEGFCVYADITLAIRFLQKDGLIKKAMIIDLDAHQGNGHERDFKSNSNVYILDVYNGKIFPFDEKAKKGINRKVELSNFTCDSVYLKKVVHNIKWALLEFSPDLIIYNAGTDVLQGDPLGMLGITENGVIQRDELVFSMVRSIKIPIMMVTSGGYHGKSATVVAHSIMNLHKKKLITLL